MVAKADAGEIAGKEDSVPRCNGGGARFSEKKRNIPSENGLLWIQARGDTRLPTHTRPETRCTLTALEGKRDSGLALVGDLPWGSHFCQFFRTRVDLLDILIPYFRAGLEQDELCVWVTSDILTTDNALSALKKGVPGFTKYLAKRQIEIFPFTDWYLKGGRFNLQRTLRMWTMKHDEALSRGFAGMRVSGNPFWIDNKKDWDDFTSYEAEINKVIGGTKLLVLCTYSLDKCGLVEVLDVVRNHEFALARNQGAWQVVRHPAFVPENRA